jgi:hypothetical protein
VGDPASEGVDCYPDWIVNRFPPPGRSNKVGGCPFGQGANPEFISHWPTAALRSSEHVLQKDFESDTVAGVAPGNSTITSVQARSK